MHKGFVAGSGLRFTVGASRPTENLANTCNNCHGMNGVSVGPSMPSIGGLSEAYLKNIMLQWKSGERYSATMGRLIKGYSDEQIAALATHFSKLPWTPWCSRPTPACSPRQGRQRSLRDLPR